VRVRASRSDYSIEYSVGNVLQNANAPVYIVVLISTIAWLWQWTLAKALLVPSESFVKNRFADDPVWSQPVSASFSRIIRICMRYAVANGLGPLNFLFLSQTTRLTSN